MSCWALVLLGGDLRGAFLPPSLELCFFVFLAVRCGRFLSPAPLGAGVGVCAPAPERRREQGAENKI